MDVNHPDDSDVTVAIHQLKHIVYTHTHTHRAPARILKPTMPTLGKS